MLSCIWSKCECVLQYYYTQNISDKITFIMEILSSFKQKLKSKLSILSYDISTIEQTTEFLIKYVLGIFKMTKVYIGYFSIFLWCWLLSFQYMWNFGINTICWTETYNCIKYIYMTRYKDNYLWLLFTIHTTTVSHSLYFINLFWKPMVGKIIWGSWIPKL